MTTQSGASPGSGVSPLQRKQTEVHLTKHIVPGHTGQDEGQHWGRICTNDEKIKPQNVYGSFWDTVWGIVFVLDAVQMRRFPPRARKLQQCFLGLYFTCEDMTWPGWDGAEITSGCPSSHEIFKGFSLSPLSFLTASS